MVTLADYAGLKPTWCPGCGNFAILEALKKALVALELEPYQVLMVSGIGQAGKLPHYTRGNVLNMLHGRTLPAAAGARMANAQLHVIAIGGDGDGYGEGGNHFIHAARRNHDITYLVHDNQVYSLTKGQASPTSDYGFVTRTTPHGAGMPFNPLAVAIAAGSSFAARGFAGDVEHLSALIQQGIRHRGFALIDILQPCVTFNHKNTYKWYQERVYRIEEDSSYDPADRAAAFSKALEWGNRIPIGVIYRHEVPCMEDQIPVLKEGALVGRKTPQSLLGSLMGEFV
jgi:2-oxoglutarate ferredoxin oxidoreductase subunit beta